VLTSGAAGSGKRPGERVRGHDDARWGAEVVVAIHGAQCGAPADASVDGDEGS